MASEVPAGSGICQQSQRFGLGVPNSMPTPSTANLPIPKDWDEFENLCADLFSKEWGDRNATRNGRQGQRQHGVDIYAFD